ncbi:MAG: TetR/AcrR family transcriptional regulator [Desulfobacterales bacterium]|nr:TetR/AcrR family transcriptional regulator [Desulfobacterales bacterium]
MKRDRHKSEIRSKVLDVSKRLFVAQGYSRTTIKQIISAAGITTGSLYHFFRNKEDILLHVAEEMFHMATELGDSFIADTDHPGLRFALEIALQLHFILEDKTIGEIYLAAYGSSQISERICMWATDRNTELFKAHNPGFTHEDFYTRSLAIKGILHSFIDEYAHYNKLADRNRIDSILGLTLSLFNLPDEEIRDTIKKTDKLIKSRLAELRGNIPT